MPEYVALVYASALVIGADDGDEDEIDTGDLGTARFGYQGRVHAHRWFDTLEFSGTFDTQKEFRACLREMVDTGDLGDPKIRRIQTRERGQTV